MSVDVQEYDVDDWMYIDAAKPCKKTSPELDIEDSRHWTRPYSYPAAVVRDNVDHG